MTIKKLITLLYSCTVAGMFLPWFHFSDPIVSVSGINYFFSPLTIWIIISGILLFLPGNSKGQQISTFVFIALIPITCIYYFLAWHMLLIYGETTIIHRLASNHYGFFITLISSLILLVIYAIYILKMGNEN